MSKISNKLVKVNEAFTINRYDNGFMIEVSGKDHDDNWRTIKLLCSTEEELITLIKEANSIPKDE